MRETINITAKKINKKLHDLTEDTDFMLGDESEVEESLFNSNFEENILDLLSANALGSQSDSDEDKNLPLQQLVRKKEQKKDDTGKKSILRKSPTQTPAAPSFPIYK